MSNRLDPDQARLFIGPDLGPIVVFVFVFNVPPTAKVIWRRDIGLKSYPTDLWSRESNLRPLVYKASGLSTTPQRPLGPIALQRLWADDASRQIINTSKNTASIVSLLWHIWRFPINPCYVGILYSVDRILFNQILFLSPSHFAPHTVSHFPPYKVSHFSPHCEELSFPRIPCTKWIIKKTATSSWLSTLHYIHPIQH